MLFLLSISVRKYQWLFVYVDLIDGYKQTTDSGDRKAIDCRNIRKLLLAFRRLMSSILLAIFQETHIKRKRITCSVRKPHGRCY